MLPARRLLPAPLRHGSGKSQGVGVDKVKRDSCPRRAYVPAGQTQDGRINSPGVTGPGADGGTERQEGRFAQGEPLTRSSMCKGGRQAEQRSWGRPQNEATTAE